MICDGMCYLLTRQSFRITTLHPKKLILTYQILNFLLFSMLGSTTEKQLWLWRISPFICEEHSAGWNILYRVMFVYFYVLPAISMIILFYRTSHFHTCRKQLSLQGMRFLTCVSENNEFTKSFSFFVVVFLLYTSTK